MYHYIEDKEFEQKMRSYCANIINQLVQRINNDGFITVKAELIGSGKRKLITQNAKEPVDLDYNLYILSFKGRFIPSERDIKEYVRKQFNILLNKNGWGDCKDSTSALTTKCRDFPHLKNKTEFFIDLGIVKQDQYGWHRLIHQKTGNIIFDRYYWNLIPNSRSLAKKVDVIKEENLWMEVKKTYLDKKNMYLRKQDSYHPSFIVYIETINEIYNKYFNQRRNYYDFRSLC